jgi:hypothetical protein
LKADETIRNITKKIDLPGVLAYKIELDVMDFRCSSLMAGLVLLIGASGAFFAPAVRAGDRIDFSDPAIPLAIPRPEVEIKEPQKTIGSISMANGPSYEGDFLPPQEFTVTKPRTRNKDPWNANPLLDDADPRADDDLFSARPEPNRLTNGSQFNLQRNSDARDSDRMLLRKEDSKFGIDPNASRLGARIGWDKDNGREDDLFGRDRFNKKNESSLLKVFSLDPAAQDRFRAWEPKSFPGESSSLTGAGSADAKTKWGLPADAARTPALPSGYGSYDPADNRPTGEQGQTTPGYVRAWEPADAHPAPARRASNPDQVSASHVVAPNRPVNLKIPKRPSDPNPY